MGFSIGLSPIFTGAGLKGIYENELKGAPSPLSAVREAPPDGGAAERKTRLAMGFRDFE
jgi:hypothetical protein